MVVITGPKQSAQKPLGGARPHKDQASNGSRQCVYSLGRRGSLQSKGLDGLDVVVSSVARAVAPFFDFVQNLTDFMQAVGRVQRLVSPVLRR